MSTSAQRLVVYSDFLCPWCYVGALRMADLEAELGDAVSVTWKSFLLRPQEKTGRSLEKFQAYTQSWSGPAAEEPRAGFRVWDGEEGPPSHSVPPHLAAKAAERLDAEAARRLRSRLFEAYFRESRDVTREANLRALWQDAGLAAGDFEQTRDPALARAVFSDYDEALRVGATGVPAVRLEPQEFVLMGAQPTETYLRWLRRQREAET